MKVETLVSNGKVVIPKTGIRDLNIAITNGKIVGLFEPSFPVKANMFIDVKGNYVLPGVIDPHTHVGENDYLTEKRPADQAVSAIL